MDPFSLMMGVGGIAANMFGQSQTNRMQMDMMHQQQSFQEMMSNTAYQRASADMKAAGLNPMMMFSSGSAASTPPGAQSSANVKSGLDADSMQKAISTAVQAKVANATIDNLVEQNAKIKAEAATERERPALVVADTGLRKASTATERQRPALVRAETDTERQKAWELSNRGWVLNQEIPIVRNKALTAENEERINHSARRLADQAAFFGKRVSDTISPVSDLVSSASRAKWLLDSRWH